MWETICICDQSFLIQAKLSLNTTRTYLFSNLAQYINNLNHKILSGTLSVMMATA